MEIKKAEGKKCERCRVVNNGCCDLVTDTWRGYICQRCASAEMGLIGGDVCIIRRGGKILALHVFEEGFNEEFKSYFFSRYLDAVK